jgi:hypothetical protein
LGGQGLTGAIGWQWGETRWRREQAVADVLWRTEKLLRASTWSEVDVPRPGLRELMEEDDGGGSVHVERSSWWFELEAVAARRGHRGESFAWLRRWWQQRTGRRCEREEQSGGERAEQTGGERAEQSGGERVRRRNGRELLVTPNLSNKPGAPTCTLQYIHEVTSSMVINI